MFPRLKSGPEHNKNWTNRLVLSNTTASVDPLARRSRSAKFLVTRFGYSRRRKAGFCSCSMGRGICIPAASNVPVYLADRKKSCGEVRLQTGWGCNAGRRLARRRNIHGNRSNGTERGFGSSSVLGWLCMIVLSIIPIVMFFLAAYEGSLFALLVLMFGALLVWGARTSAAVYSSHRRSR
jgi:hypothetical protein